MIQELAAAAARHPGLACLYALAWLGIIGFVAYVALRRAPAGHRHFRRIPRLEIATTGHRLEIREFWGLTLAEEEEILNSELNQSK